MRLGQFSTGDAERPWVGAVVDDETVIDLPTAGAAAGVEIPRDLSSLLGQWAWQRKATLAVDHAVEAGVAHEALGGLQRHAPVTDPQKVVCVGLNYVEHVEEGDHDRPDEPLLFSKFPTSVTGPGGDIAWDPDYTQQVDFEAELVAVVGREARDVDPDEATDYLAGLTVGNDVSARDLQHGDGQWVRGKSLDTFAPTGPDLVTLDEVEDPHDLDIWSTVDGERMQASSTENLIFGLDELVSFCSRAFTLTPGDLIFTGTPPGVGIYREPPVLLDDGVEVTVGVEGLGELTNVCRHR